jgi:hypothetical protein
MMEPQEERRANGTELFLILNGEMRGMPILGVSAQYSIGITKELLYPALAEIIKSEPLLGVNVFKKRDDKNRYYRKITAVNLDTVVKFLPEQSVESFTEEFFKIRVPYEDDTLPLWRIFVLGDREILLGYDHAAFDGNSGAMIHKSLANYLGVTTSLESPIVPTCNKPIRPGLTDMVDIKPSIVWLLKVVFKELIFSRLFSQRKGFRVGVPVVWPYSSKTVVATLNAADTEILLNRSKQLKIPLTTILLVCWIQTVLKELPHGKESISIRSDCTVDLRRFLGSENANTLRNFVGLYEFGNVRSNHMGDVFAEAVARDFNAGLRRGLIHIRGDITFGNGALDLFDVEGLLKQMKRCNLVQISNLGAKSIEGQKCRVEDMTFFQAAGSVAGTYSMNAVSVKGGNLQYGTFYRV